MKVGKLAILKMRPAYKKTLAKLNPSRPPKKTQGILDTEDKNVLNGEEGQEHFTGNIA